MLSLRLSPALLERVDAWRSQQSAVPARTAVITAALEQFLDREETPKNVPSSQKEQK